MDRSDFYYDQEVTEAEVDQAFNDVERMEQDQVIESDTWGVTTGLAVTENGPPDLNVLVSAGTAYDDLGRRIDLTAPALVDLTTEVPAVGGEQVIIHIYAEDFDVETDPRVDGLSVALNYRLTEGCALSYVAGADAAPPAARPAIVPNKVLLAEVELNNGDATILNAKISADWYGVAAANVDRQVGGVISPGRLLGEERRLAYDGSISDTVITVGGGNTLDFNSAILDGATVYAIQRVGSFGINTAVPQGFMYIQQALPHNLLEITKWWGIDASEMYPDENNNQPVRAGAAANAWNLENKAATTPPTNYTSIAAWEIEINNGVGTNYTFGLIIPIHVPDGCKLISGKVGVEVSATMGANTFLNLYLCRRQGDTIDVLSDDPPIDWNQTPGAPTYYSDLAEAVTIAPGPEIVDNSAYSYFMIVQGKQTAADNKDVIRITNAHVETKIREASHVY